MIQAFLAMQVMTFNAAGIPFIHPRWRQRRQAIAQALRQSPYDLIALQEVWGRSDAGRLAQASGRPYWARVPSGLFGGNGLLILSRFPVIETRHKDFSCAPSSLSQLRYGEFIARKGALAARVKTPQGEIDVYDTHFVSDYPQANHSSWRQSQIFEFFEMVENFSRDKPVLILADLNVGPQDEDYRLLRDLLGLEDSCLRKGLEICGISNDAAGKRIDHILVPDGAPMSFHPRLDLTQPIAGLGIPYSDHKAVAAELGPAILTRHLRPDVRRQTRALEIMQTSLRLLKKSVISQANGRKWIPLYGFLEERIAETQSLKLESIGNRLDALLIARYKELGVKP